ncbi:Prolyl 4-hydroxylase subunit alpha-1 [Orchesella cincta]|uniref:Prolyl 4-hydroxylase subunit alpha-1 n=1 Tax=Orchesella cincta TaxID=48709 RepID=A0A1D2MXU8_ORCCI|nr:Prolyl 4-hydroxylase subunit alpha-1 [Orchesella cincta]
MEPVLLEYRPYENYSNWNNETSSIIAYNTDIPSRPRNCEAHIIIVPILGNLEDQNETLFISTAKQWPLHIATDSELLVESIFVTRFRYDVLISPNDNDVYQESWFEQVTAKVMSGSNERTLPPTVSWELLYFRFEASVSSWEEEELLGETKYLIKTVELLCHHCHPSRYPFVACPIHHVNEDPSLTKERLYEIIFELNANTVDITWVLYSHFSPKKPFGNFIYTKTRKERQFFRHGTGLHGVDDERLLFYVFGNASYCEWNERSELYELCNSTIVSYHPHLSYVRRIPYKRMHFPFHYNQLQWGFNKKGVHDIEIVEQDNKTGETYHVEVLSLISLYFNLLIRESNQTLSKREEYILNNTRMYLKPKIKYGKGNSWSSSSGLTLLYNCSDTNKIAVVAENTRILKFHSMYTMKHGNNKRFQFPLSFGKDVLATLIKGITMLNWVNPKIVVRIKALYSSGILDWHENRNKSAYKYSGRLVDLVETNYFRPTTMTASFKLVFIIWMGGVFVGCIAFLTEPLVFQRKRYPSMARAYMNKVMGSGVDFEYLLLAVFTTTKTLLILTLLPFWSCSGNLNEDFFSGHGMLNSFRDLERWANEERMIYKSIKFVLKYGECQRYGQPLNETVLWINSTLEHFQGLMVTNENEGEIITTNAKDPLLTYGNVVASNLILVLRMTHRLWKHGDFLRELISDRHHVTEGFKLCSNNSQSFFEERWPGKRENDIAILTLLTSYDAHDIFFSPGAVSFIEKLNAASILKQVSVTAEIAFAIFKMAVTVQYYVQAFDWINYAMKLTKQGDTSIPWKSLEDAKRNTIYMHNVDRYKFYPTGFYSSPISVDDMTTTKELNWLRIKQLHYTHLHGRVGQKREFHLANMWDLFGKESAVKAKLTCYFDTKRHPWLSINPLRVEVLSEPPIEILLFHDVLGDKLLSEIVETLDKEEKTVSEINGIENDESVSAFYKSLLVRSSVATWFQDKAFPKLLFLSEVVSGLVGSSDIPTQAEAFQAVEYAVGRYYNAHHDERLRDAPEIFQKKTEIGGVRTATLLFYLNDVEQGGQTVFTSAGVVSPPKKGNALFWYINKQVVPIQQSNSKLPLFTGQNEVVTPKFAVARIKDGYLTGCKIVTYFKRKCEEIFSVKCKALTTSAFMRKILLSPLLNYPQMPWVKLENPVPNAPIVPNISFPSVEIMGKLSPISVHYNVLASMVIQENVTRVYILDSKQWINLNHHFL